LLSTEQEIPIGVAVRFTVRSHGSVDHVYVERDSFADIWISGAGEGV
jgi:hypothetical protein